MNASSQRRRGISAAAFALVAASLLVFGLGARDAAGSSAAVKCGTLPNFVAYVCGKAGAANPKLKPALIGWANNQGGSIISEGPEATEAVQMAIKWINKHAGGISGHPLKLVPCYVKNAEEEGKACANKFLANKDIHVVTAGSLAFGAQTLNATNKGRVPVIIGFSNSVSDLKAKNTYILFAAGPYDFYAWGTFGKKYLKAKTAAVVFANNTGFVDQAKGVVRGAQSVGIKTKSVGYDPTASDLTGALVAAGAQTADMIVPVGGTPANCISIKNGLEKLGVDPGKVVGNFSCSVPSEKPGYGGDYPKWFYGQAQSGDSLTNSPIGVNYRKVLAEFGMSENKTNVWTSGMFGLTLTLAQFMNKIGYDNLSKSAMAKQAQTFRGPLLLGEPHPQCGKYPDAPGLCGGGTRFFRYGGNDTWIPVSLWEDVPIPLQCELKAKGVKC